MPSLLTLGLTIAIVAVLAAALGTSNPQTVEPLKRCIEARALFEPGRCRPSDTPDQQPEDTSVRPSTDPTRTAADLSPAEDIELSTL